MKNRIAVVEDDRLIRDMILLKLKKAGYAATGFDSAEAFLMEGTEKSHDVIILRFFPSWYVPAKKCWAACAAALITHLS